jgi:mono/diheme cytochrome c family protein
MLHRCLAAAIALCAVGAFMPSLAPAAPAAGKPDATVRGLDERYESEIKPLFKQYCYACHGEGKSKGKFAMDHFEKLSELQSKPEKWHKALENLRDHTMPPEEKPQPTQQQMAAMMTWIADVLNAAHRNATPDPGRVTIRRLNRTEYNNTIRDLLGVNTKPASRFPTDDSGYGFDNIADVLSMSPLLAEKYVAAAEEILETAIVLPKPIEVEKAFYNGSTLRAKGEPAIKSNKINNTLIASGKSVGVVHSFKYTGDYQITVRGNVQDNGGKIGKGQVKVAGKELGVFEFKDSQTTIQKRIHVDAGNQSITVNFWGDSKAPESRKLSIRSVSIEGPYNPVPPPLPESHKKIFAFAPKSKDDDRNAARQNLQRFATRAFRRPVTSQEVDRLMKLYDTAKTQDVPMEQAMKLPLTAVLVSPHFLFRIESDEGADAKGIRTLNDYELATRLSYFLWSSMPDDELFKLAESKELHKDDVLIAQVKRMIKDSKATALTSNFAGQWLELRALEDISPDTEKFKQFDDGLRHSMRREVEMLFEHIVKEDRSILEFISSDYTFVNNRLAKLYGMKNVDSSEFQRVSTAGTPRGGVITSAAILTLTSNPTRTSPVKRGVYVLDQILGVPPPTPPAGVPPLPEGKTAEATGSVRQRLTAHQQDPNCSVCHRRLDPIGFALENFDAIGRWREKEGEFPIDASGNLPDGSKFNGPDGLKKLLISRKDQVARAIAERMLTYALGRGIEYYDRAAVDIIAGNIAKNDYRFSALVAEIVKSDPFRKRRVSTKRGES